MATARKDIVSGSAASIVCPLPDAPGVNGGAFDGPGPSGVNILAVRGCLYVAASAVVSVYLRWNDPDQGSNPQSMLLGTATAGTSATQVPFSFAPFSVEDGTRINPPFSSSVSVFAVSNGAAQTQTVTNSSHLLVDYCYS